MRLVAIVLYPEGAFTTDKSVLEAEREDDRMPVFRRLPLPAAMFVGAAFAVQPILAAPPAAPLLNVRVTASHLDRQCEVAVGGQFLCKMVQELTVVINDQVFQLADRKTDQDKGRGGALLKLGTYKGVFVYQEVATDYRSSQTFIMEFPDGKTEDFTVVGRMEP